VKHNVWGIGLTRTGTTSLNRALELLGYRAVHYPTLSQLLHEPLEAATDEPVAVTYKYLDFLYPDSKFILTDRDEDDWIRSAAAHRKRHFERRRQWSPLDSPFAKPSGNWLQAQVSTILGQSLLRDRTVERVFTQTTLYGTVEFDEEKFRQGYRRHCEDVARYFGDRPDDLLRMRICDGEGWERLCALLGCRVPSVPFPTLNTAAVAAS
jgi:sulfotransferase family protein